MLRSIFTKLASFRGGENRPRLFQPRVGARPTPRERDELLSAGDRSYEEARLDLELERSLKAEFQDKLAPPDSFHQVMLRIREHEAEEALKRAAALAPAPLPSPTPAFFGRLLEGLSSRAGNGTYVRIASGAIGMLLVLASIGPSISTVLNGQGRAGYPSLIYVESTTSEAELRFIEHVMAESSASHNAAPVYDRTALRLEDPPETLAPPRRVLDRLAGAPADDSAPRNNQMKKE